MPDYQPQKGVLIFERTLFLCIYLFLLGWTLYNIWRYLVLKKRYREFSVTLYYASFLGLFMTRVAMTAY